MTREEAALATAKDIIKRGKTLEKTARLLVAMSEKDRAVTAAKLFKEIHRKSGRGRIGAEI